MLQLIKKFLKEEDGLNTVEIVIILAVLVGIALLFRKKILDFVNKVIGSIFEGDSTKEFLDDPTGTN